MNAPLASDSDSQLPRWFGDYVLLKRLGKGGMGQVFLARSPGVAGIDRLCVIKTLRSQWTNDREYVARFVDEARVVVQLNHRNICPVFDVGQVHNTYYLAMDLVPGRDVQAVMEACARYQLTLPIDLTLLIVGEILEALDAAHRLRDPETDAPLNLVHRDISPHNALISFDGDVKLIDFGLALSALKQERTEPGVVLGKMAYMAPEHARGDGVDRRADLFAVGVMLYELAAGERYWQDFSMQDIWQVVGQGSHRPAKLRQLPVDVQAIIEKATAASPADRYSTGAEMRAALTMVQLSRGIIASSADLRTQMEQLFDGESAADRRERAALMKLPAPGTTPQIELQSTRIARAPGSTPSLKAPMPAPTPAPTVPPPYTGDEVPTLVTGDGRTESAEAQAAPGEAPSVVAPAHTTAVRRGTPVGADGSKKAPPPAPPPAAAPPAARAPAPSTSWVRRGAVALAAVVAAGGVVVALTRSSAVAPPVVPPAPVVEHTTPKPVEPVVVPVVPVVPVVEPAPVEPAPQAVVEPVPVEPVASSPSPTRPKPTKPTKPTIAATPPVEPAAPAVAPWPTNLPRMPGGKQSLLRERCSQRPCAAPLLRVVPEKLPTPELATFVRNLNACLDACRAASTR